MRQVILLLRILHEGECRTASAAATSNGIYRCQAKQREAHLSTLIFIGPCLGTSGSLPFRPAIRTFFSFPVSLPIHLRYQLKPPLYRVYTRHMKTPHASTGRELAAMPDEDLMLLVAGGFIEAPATELFIRHNRMLYNFVVWQCQGNIATAEDITQRTWDKIMTRCSFYTPQAAFRTFLFQIARKLWIDQNRAAAESLREPPTEALIESAADELAPETELALRQNLDRVRHAVMALPFSQREVVVLRFFSEMSLEEIAQTIGSGFETVKSRLRYAFTRLLRELEASS